VITPPLASGEKLYTSYDRLYTRPAKPSKHK
jgi:hypothetical protein